MKKNNQKNQSQTNQKDSKAKEKKEMEKIKKDLETLKDKLLKKFDKYILGITLLPPKKDSDDIQALVFIDDSDSKKMSKEELKNKLSTIIASIAKEINKKLNINTLLHSEFLENCYDNKFEHLDMIAKSAIVYDKGLLSAAKIGEVHKKMILSKFEKYIVAYILFGSLTRGEATDKSDIDVAIIIDDTDVKRMSRAELKDKLRAIIIGMGMEAGEITGIKNKLNIQVYILTDFWESVRDANPVIFTVLRDGVPFYDRGIFMPWKQLLKMGKIKPSQEAIEMFMNTGDEIIKRIRNKIKNLVESDIYWATLTPSQAALMVYGIPPPTPKETIKLMDEIFVKKEKILEEEYVQILKNNRKYYKDLEHGDIKEISGSQVDKLLNDSEKYLKRIKKLFDALYAKKEKESITEIKDEIISITRELLKTQNIEKIKENEILKLFKEHIIEKNILPNKYKDILKTVLDKINQSKKLTKNELNSIRKKSQEFIKESIETIQRIQFKEIEKIKLRITYDKDKIAELYQLNDKIYFIKDIKNNKKIKELIFKNKKTEEKEITPEKFEKEIQKNKQNKKIRINQEISNYLNKELKTWEILIN